MEVDAEGGVDVFGDHTARAEDVGPLVLGPPRRAWRDDVGAGARLFLFVFVLRSGAFGLGILLLGRLGWVVARCICRLCSGLRGEHGRGFARIVLRFQIDLLLFQKVLLDWFRGLYLLLFGVLLRRLRRQWLKLFFAHLSPRLCLFPRLLHLWRALVWTLVRCHLFLLELWRLLYYWSGLLLSLLNFAVVVH